MSECASAWKLECSVRDATIVTSTLSKQRLTMSIMKCIGMVADSTCRVPSLRPALVGLGVSRW